MAETVGPVLPSLRVSMEILLEVGGGRSRAVSDEANMRRIHCNDKLDNPE
jgi:hypothetical protein